MHSNTLTVTKVSIIALGFAFLGAISVGYVAALTASSTEPVEPALPEEPVVAEEPALPEEPALVEEPTVAEEETVPVAASSTEATEPTPEHAPPTEPEPQEAQEPNQASTTPEESTSSGGGAPSADAGTAAAAPEGEVLGASDSADATTTPEVSEEVVEEVPPGPNPLSMTTAISIAALQDAYFGEHGKYLQVLRNNTLPSYEDGTVQELLGSTIADNAYVDVYESYYGMGYQIVFDEDGVTYSAGYGPEAADRTFTYTPPLLVASSTSPEM